MAYDEAHAEKMRAALASLDLVEKKMFGGLGFMLNGNMLCGLGMGVYMFRVGAEREAEALARGGNEIAMGSRKMGGYVGVDPDDCDDDAMADWIAYAKVFVDELPPK